MLYSLLVKKPVYSKENKILGCVKDVGIEYATGKILELIAGSFLKLKRENIAINNIKIEEDRILYDGLSVGAENVGAENFQPLRGNEIGSIINKEVYTESGDFLGKVKDFKIDLNFWRLSDIRVKSLSYSRKLIIGENQIISIDKDKIVVKDALVENVIAGIAT